MRELDTLYELQCLDAELRTKEQRLENLFLDVPAMEEAQQAQIAYEPKEKEFQALRVDMKDRELEVDSLSERIKKLDRELLSGKGGVKELMEKQTELESLKDQKRRLEDTLLDMMEKMETLTSSLAEAKKDWERKEREKERVISELGKEKVCLEEEISALGKRREELIALLPATLISVYEELRAYKMGRAVVAVKNGRCSGCQIIIAHRYLVELRKGESIQFCENCGRILYWGEGSS